jgi:hypothetical protein
VIYGALLIFGPVVGALVLTPWLGAYAIVFRFGMAVAIHCTSDSVTSHTADVATPTELSCPITPYSCRLWVIRDRAERASIADNSHQDMGRSRGGLQLSAISTGWLERVRCRQRAVFS